MIDPSGIVINWNTGAERIKGYTADEIIGQHISRFYSREDRAAGLPARGLATAAREGRYETEGWRVRKDGTRFWAAVVLDAIHDPEGALIGFAKNTRDITKRREAQDRLRESERLNEVMEAARPILDSLLSGTVRWVTTILPDVWPVRGNSELAIVNMSVNARDAMGQGGGTIALKTLWQRGALTVPPTRGSG
jgi:PAS domain S-box-containing protein